jgi:putative CocE/NonD family hydrolase
VSMSAPSPLSRKRSSSGLVALLALCTFASGVLAESVMVPMADGTRLATHYHLPDDAGPWPVIVVRTVYGLGGIATEALTEQGYAVVTQYTRGRFDSEGTDMVFADDGWGNRRDGADTLAWVRAQPWCNGKIGTWGPSALGITQVMLAGADKNIAAQCIIVAASNFWCFNILCGKKRSVNGPRGFVRARDS